MYELFTHGPAIAAVSCVTASLFTTLSGPNVVRSEMGAQVQIANTLRGIYWLALAALILRAGGYI